MWAHILYQDKRTSAWMKYEKETTVQYNVQKYLINHLFYGSRGFFLSIRIKILILNQRRRTKAYYYCRSER